MREFLYVDWDEDMQLWCIFHTETGKCHGTFCDEQTAEEYLLKNWS